MSAVPHGAADEWAAIGEHSLPARPIRNKVAICLPRTATVGLLGLSLLRSQQSQAPLQGVAALTFAFFGTNYHQRSLARQTVIAVAPPLLVWTLEAYRTSNAWVQIALPCIFGAATQVFGIDKVAPVYYAYTIFAGDTTCRGSPVDPDAAMAVLPATLVGHVFPAMLMSALPLTATEASRSYFTLQSIVCYAFYFSPFTVSLLAKGISAAVKWLRRRSSLLPSPVARPKAAQADQSDSLLTLKGAYATMFTLQALEHVFDSGKLLSSIRKTLAPFSFGDRLLLLKEAALNSSWWSGASWENRPDQVQWEPALRSSLTSFKYSTLVFGLYNVWDLRTRGYITTREARLAAVTYVFGFGLVGAGACYTGLWYWRECVLHRTGHHSSPKHQVTVS